MAAVKAAPAHRRLVSLDSAAAQLDVSPRTIRRRINDGTIPGYRIGRLLRVDPDDLNRITRPATVKAGEAA